MSGDLVRRSNIMTYVEHGNVETELAEEDLAATRAKWAAGTTAADRRVATAYAAVEEGRQLVDLYKVLVRGGQHTRDVHDVYGDTHKVATLPKLAVAPVWAKDVTARASRTGEIRYRAAARLGLRRFEMLHESTTWSGDPVYREGTARLPTMPPSVAKVANDDDLILWEASWRKINKIKSKLVPPPVLDPAILEHVSGSLYVVKATWDLTDLEAAALR